MKNNHVYVIATDILDPRLDPVKLKDLIKSDPTFSAWWNHLPGVFLVTSEANAEEITDVLRTVVNKTNLLVIEANPSESEGWLPTRSWDWIRRRTPAKAGAKTNA